MREEVCGAGCDVDAADREAPLDHEAPLLEAADRGEVDVPPKEPEARVALEGREERSAPPVRVTLPADRAPSAARGAPLDAVTTERDAEWLEEALARACGAGLELRAVEAEAAPEPPPAGRLACAEP
jgi:hypothetical protein